MPESNRLLSHSLKASGLTEALMPQYENESFTLNLMVRLERLELSTRTLWCQRQDLNLHLRDYATWCPALDDSDKVCCSTNWAKGVLKLVLRPGVEPRIQWLRVTCVNQLRQRSMKSRRFLNRILHLSPRLYLQRTAIVKFSSFEPEGTSETRVSTQLSW